MGRPPAQKWLVARILPDRPLKQSGGQESRAGTFCGTLGPLPKKVPAPPQRPNLSMSLSTRSWNGLYGG